MRISLEDYPELIEGLINNSKLEDILTEGTLTKIADTMVADFEDALWDDWDFDIKRYKDISSTTIGNLTIKAEAYNKAFEVLNNTSYAEFNWLYPSYFEFIEDARIELNEFERKVKDGMAEVKLREVDSNE